MNLDKHRLTKNILVAAIMGASSVQVVVPPSLVYAANSVVANDRLPTNGHVINGSVEIKDPINNQLDINQSSQNAIITWNDFSIGANATVNFNKDTDTFNGRFNTLNYVNSGNLSQIYGTINANEGNVFIVNPAGVEIGNSAQINVGSLYVSNNLNNQALKDTFGKATVEGLPSAPVSNGDLMSLGNINAGKVTFDGDRIVLDVDRIRPVEKYENGDLKYDDDGKLIYEKPSYENPYGQYDSDLIEIHTTDKDKVIAGYTYKDSSINYTAKNELKVDAEGNGGIRVFENGTKKGVSGYKWVKDYDQLQKINGELDGNFALRNSIDANGETFKPIGDENKSFTGNFDGLGFNIYGLTIGSDTDKKDNTGLFGVVDGATIGNVNLISGTIIGNNNTGALIGKIDDSGDNITKVENVLNTAQVTGTKNVGGIIGNIGDNRTDEDGLISEKDEAHKAQLSGLINTGAVSGKENVGGLVGTMNNATLGGTSYNLADISGIDKETITDPEKDYSHNIGGLVGTMSNSKIGNPLTDEDGKPIKNEDGSDPFQIYNHLDVTGGYNVGGIVGSMENSTVQNVSNDGNVTATGFKTEEYNYHTGVTNGAQLPNETTLKNGIASTTVQVANVGGIVGNSSNNSSISNVINEGDISTNFNYLDKNVDNNAEENIYYSAGNVGGVVGRAEDTNITDATNKEANIRGAHNVGGIAGYFGGSATLSGGINNGGDILATGAQNTNKNFMDGNIDKNKVNWESFVREKIRPDTESSEEDIGNMGGIVGYMYGDNTKVTGSANRGTVHSAEIKTPQESSSVKNTSKAANVGGIIGKIDRGTTKNLNEIENITEAAVNNSYNTGNVSGYTGVGGVVGMMYNGEVAGSYNLGTIKSTRTATGDSIEPLNMGGIVGDTTEQSSASVSIYDVYNKGQIGDEEFNYYGRHVGGIVGRLSGDVEKAYNNGAIYNGFTTVGGIAGWWVDGSINNVFNTGNITVNNKSYDDGTWSEVGGIAGAVEVGTTKLSNAYNLGTIRSIKAGNTNNALGGIIGNLQDFYDPDKVNLTISNVYTLGNLYVDSGSINSIIGRDKFNGERTTITNAYYIAPENDSGFIDLTSNENNNANKTIAYESRLKLAEYTYEKDGITHYLGEKENNTGINDETSNNSVDESYDWRIYEGKTTPILNAFIPNTEDYLSKEVAGKDGEYYEGNEANNISSIQYGTAYDPLLTIIKADRTGDVSFDWQDLGMSGDAGLAVYDGGLTLTNFANLGGTGFFGGTIYTDGNLNITNVQENVDTNTDIRFGSSSKIYGSSISISADGNFEGYGDIIATGNNNGTGNISLSGDNVDIYGKLQSAVKNEDTFISGVEDTAHKHDDILSKDEAKNIEDPSKEMVAVEDRYTHKVTSRATGNITVTATDGDVNIYYGNEEKGFVDTEGNMNITANSGNVYVDSDLNIKGNLEVTSPNETVIDITNIGKVQNKDVEADKQDEAIAKTMHEFLHSFYKNSNEAGAFIFHTGKDADNSNVKITVDLWKDGKYNLDKYTDIVDGEEHSLVTELENLDVRFNDGNSEENGAADITYIWVADGAQLNGISSIDYKNYNEFKGKLNFALKNDINATDIKNYQSIGGTDGYTGTFDGRGNRIIGLNTDEVEITDEDGKSLFGIIGEGGQVKNLKVYSSNFDMNGAIAETNNGTINNVTGLGNHVTGTDGSSVGGLVGLNNGIISSSTDRSSVIAGVSISSIGGLAGNNSGTKAKIENSSSNSAVSGGSATNVGGVVGSNTGTIDNADSLGITNGASNVGGIVGTNDINGSISSVYNESIIIGSGNNIGGVAGLNNGTKYAKGSLTNVANAGDIKATAENAQYIGGIIGNNNGTVDGGRNNARIEGKNYVGGIVGNNGATSDLHNITNDSSAFIVGEEYVGGIAGSNEGTITGEDINTDESKASLINRGTITGQKYVGGVAGRNTGNTDNKGIITNVNSDMTLNVKDKDAIGDNAPKYFGGVVGLNDKYGVIEDATNSANINAEEADYVGGIAGQNDGHLQGAGNSNKGNVIGNSNVGGVVGLNNADIKGTNGTEQGMVGISNEGKVTAMQGGAGGIIGTNKADIEYAHLVNKGQVIGNYDTEQDPDTGEYGTGGLIGILEEGKTIKHSDLINEKNGIVTGGKNVGGLIGINKGTVEGGRDENDGYYKYRIYNNGAIVGKDGENIGGLIGQNNGTLTAGYNTGAINITNGENVGGIVGNNAGTVDQVFNTVGGNVDKVDIMDKDDPTKVKEHYDVVEQISGATNVGGLIGTNSGTLSNAYNTSDVKSTNAGIVGNAIGNNENDNKKGTAKNIYATNISGNLIGSNNGNVESSYSFSEADKEKNGITYLENDKVQKDEDSYNFVDENNNVINKDNNNTWKFYDGSTNPLLKVFLTKAQFTPAKDKDGKNIEPNFVYNANTQGVLIRYDEATEKVEVLDAKNIVIGFIEVADEDAAHSLMDYINSINGASGDNTPNDGKQLINGTQFIDAGTYEMLFSQQINTDGQQGNPNNLGYDFVTSLGISGTPGDNTPPTITNDKAQISIDLNDIERNYGNSTILNGNNYGHTVNWANSYNGKDFNDKMKDELKDTIIFNGMTDDGALSQEPGRTTSDAGDHKWTGSVTFDTSKGKDKNHLDKNYEFITVGNDQKKQDNTITATGGSKVKKVDLYINVNDEQILEGETPNYTGKVSGLVNGDTESILGSHQYGVENPDIGMQVGTHKGDIGIWIGNTFYKADNQGNVNLKNYTVKINPGTLTVTPIIHPEDDKRNWNNLLNDAPWDRNRDFRERKAEFNHVNGGITIEKNDEDIVVEA